MSDHLYKQRSNYFKVKDEKKFEEIMKSADAEFWKAEDSEGVRYAFTNLDWEDNDTIEKLQEVIDEDDAIIVCEVRHEKLRYLVASAMIITSDSIDYVDLHQEALWKAQEMLGDKNWNTILDDN